MGLFFIHLLSIQTGKILQIGHQRCFKPSYIKAIEDIRSGKIGKVNQIRAWWHRNNDWRRPFPAPGMDRQIVYSYADGTKFVYDSMISNKFYGLEQQVLGDTGTLELETNKFYSENPPKPAGIRIVIALISKLFRKKATVS